MAESQYVGRYICIDPGEDTGFSLLQVAYNNRPVKLLDAITVKYKADSIYDTIGQLYYYDSEQPSQGMPTTVILEKFVHRPGRPFNATAYKVMGICEAWYQHNLAVDRTLKYIERTPVQGKSEADDTVLRRLNMYLPTHSQRHMNDSTRHGVSWLIEKGHRATCLVAKPKGHDD